MQSKLLPVITVAIAFGIAVVLAERTFEWAIVGMLASLLVILAYDAFQR